MPSTPATAEEVNDLLDSAREVLGRLEPVAIGLSQVPAVFDALVSLQQIAAGAVTRMSARYDEAGAWKRTGARSAADALARKTGTSQAKARRRLETSKRLPSQPGTDAAIRDGALSTEQADEVSSGADASPSDEAKLLDSARGESLRQLRQRVADARARADSDREATRRRLHRQRCLRRWNDADGMGNLLLRLPADEMAEIDAALKWPIDRRLADARHAGRFEPPEAYAADAVRDRLLSPPTTGRSGETGTSEPAGASDPPRASGPEPPPRTEPPPEPTQPGEPTPSLEDRPRAGAAPPAPDVARGGQAVRPDKKVIAVVDINALNRGSLEDGEQCEIAGVGPVSVGAVRRLLADAFVAVVFRDGVDIRNVTHLGRRITAHQRTALEARGGACEFCGSTFRVEIDHVRGWALTHETHIDDLSLKCWSCHQLKTRHDLRETGPPGARRFLHPDGRPWIAPSPAARTSAAIQDELFTTAR